MKQEKTSTAKKKKTVSPRGATVLVEKEKFSLSKTGDNIKQSIPSGAPTGLLLALVAVGLIWLGQLIASSPRVHLGWQVAQVEIEGEFRYWQPRQIIEQIIWVKKKNFLTVDVREVQQALEALSLVKSAKVKKIWPETLLIQVKEDIPVALWNGQFLLNPLGQELPRPKNFETNNLPQLSGRDAQAEEVMRQYQRFQSRFEPIDEKIEALEVSDWGNWQMTLSNGWSVVLGRKDIEQRMLRLMKLIQTLPAEQVEKVDLRYGKGAAIKWLAAVENNS